MALTSPGSNCALARIFSVASLTCCHQVSGCCSAQPGCLATISNSRSGEVAEARALPVPASISVALIEELPTSYPSSNAICFTPSQVQFVVFVGATGTPNAMRSRLGFPTRNFALGAPTRPRGCPGIGQARGPAPTDVLTTLSLAPNRRRCTGRRWSGGSGRRSGSRPASGRPGLSAFSGSGSYSRREAGGRRGQHAVEVDLDVLVVVDRQLQIAQARALRQVNSRRSQMSAVFHSVPTIGAGRALRAEAAGALLPAARIEVRLEPAVGLAGSWCSARWRLSPRAVGTTVTSYRRLGHRAPSWRPSSCRGRRTSAQTALS